MKKQDSFQQNLRRLRQQKNISQQRLSELCGLHPDAVRRYECGEAQPTLKSLRRLADFFKVGMDELTGEGKD